MRTGQKDDQSKERESAGGVEKGRMKESRSSGC